MAFAMMGAPPNVTGSSQHVVRYTFPDGAVNDANLFTLLGSPAGAADFIFYVNESTLGTNLFGSTYALDTGTGWHASATLTLVVQHPRAFICGGWGGGGRGGRAFVLFADAKHGGSGGAGAGPAGFAGNTYAIENKGHPSTADPGLDGSYHEGVGGKGGNNTSVYNRTPTNGAAGRHGIILRHDLTVFNYEGVIAGAGGGGGGGYADTAKGWNGGAGGTLGQPGVAGKGSSPGTGGAAGNLAKLQGYTLTWGYKGQTYGQEVA